MATPRPNRRPAVRKNGEAGSAGQPYGGQAVRLPRPHGQASTEVEEMDGPGTADDAKAAGAADRPRFAGGQNIAIKVPRYRFAETVAFYRDTLGLPVLGKVGTSESFRFGSVRLWLDCVDHQSQTDVWLELFSDDPDAAFAYLQERGVSAREEVEPLGDFPGHWVSDPAGVIFIVRRPDGEGQGTGGV